MLAMLSNSELIGPLEVAKFLFSTVYVVATIGVIVGVYWEREEFPKEKRDRGWRLLVRSLAVDTLFTVLILGTDGWIGSIQRVEIISLETRLAQRAISTEEEKIVEALKQFSGTPFDFSINPAPEPLTFANRVRAILKESGWKAIPAEGSIALGTGDDRSHIFISSIELGMEISNTKVAEWREPLAALQKALADAGFPAKANIATDGSASDNAIHIYVGAKQ
jgi:hypothetical protein